MIFCAAAETLYFVLVVTSDICISWQWPGKYPCPSDHHHTDHAVLCPIYSANMQSLHTWSFSQGLQKYFWYCVSFSLRFRLFFIWKTSYWNLSWKRLPRMFASSHISSSWGKVKQVSIINVWNLISLISYLLDCKYCGRKWCHANHCSGH